MRLQRVYEPASDADGTRVLVDRLWPRGITRAGAALDEWCRQAAPSTELRRWYAHDRLRFDDFRLRYRAELAHGEAVQAVAHLRELARHRPLTLVTATKDLEISGAAVLAEVLRE